MGKSSVYFAVFVMGFRDQNKPFLDYLAWQNEKFTMRFVLFSNATGYISLDKCSFATSISSFQPKLRIFVSPRGQFQHFEPETGYCYLKAEIKMLSIFLNHVLSFLFDNLSCI